MSRLAAGLLAGIIATTIVSLFMVLTTIVAPGSPLSFIDALVEFFARQLGSSRNLAVGWIVHLLIGVFLWGGLYALINPSSTQVVLSRGLQFGLVVWLLMMTVVMPLAGKGMFGLVDGWFSLLTTLLLHLIYGAVLALCYSRMLDPIRTVPRERLDDRA